MKLKWIEISIISLLHVVTSGSASDMLTLWLTELVTIYSLPDETKVD